MRLFFVANPALSRLNEVVVLLHIRILLKSLLLAFEAHGQLFLDLLNRPLQLLLLLLQVYPFLLDHQSIVSSLSEPRVDEERVYYPVVVRPLKVDLLAVEVGDLLVLDSLSLWELLALLLIFLHLEQLLLFGHHEFRLVLLL